MAFQEFGSNGNFSDANTEMNQQKRLQDLVANVGECSFRCIKITFFIFNLFFWIVGFFILFLAIWLIFTREDATSAYARVSRMEGYVNGPTILLAIGVVTLLLSLVACCGSRKNHVILLSFYTALLFVITTVEIGLIILAHTYRADIDMKLHKEFQTNLNSYGITGNEHVTTSIDSLQREFKCCGNQGYVDWFDTKWWQMNHGNFSVPQSCCVIARMKNCNKDIDSNKVDLIFRNGCYEHVRKYLLENLHIISGFGVWLVVLECLGIIFSVVLIIKIRKEEKFLQSKTEECYSMTTVDY